jgi:hypothetical protein
MMHSLLDLSTTADARASTTAALLGQRARRSRVRSQATGCARRCELLGAVLPAMTRDDE